MEHGMMTTKRKGRVENEDAKLWGSLFMNLE